MNKFDHVLILGFGAPTKPDEIDPYLDRFARKVGVDPSRLSKVREHYHAIGGRSPYNQAASDFSKACQKVLASSGTNIPIFVGMRNWHPFVEDALREIDRKGLKKGMGFVLAPHVSRASRDVYQENVRQALAHIGAGIEAYSYPAAWHQNPLFIEAYAHALRLSLDKGSENQPETTQVLFTAHSIPKKMADESAYPEQIAETAEAVAQKADWENWKVVFQSASVSKEPWIGPDVLEYLGVLDKGIRNVIVVPIGFLCENAEILYDLDIEAQNRCRESGIRYERTRTVLGDKRLHQMFAQLVQNELKN